MDLEEGSKPPIDNTRSFESSSDEATLVIRLKIAFATVDASSFGTESNFALGIENHEREFVKVQYFEMEF